MCKRTLPPVPKRPEEDPVISRRCGSPPTSLDLQPFFYTSLMTTIPAPGQVKPPKRKPQPVSQRLNDFYIKVCKNESDYQTLIRPDIPNGEPAKNYTHVDHDEEPIYKIPDLNPELPDSGLIVESALYSIMDRFNRTKQKFLENCPLGFTKDERRKFCLRLEYLEHDIDIDWKVFSEKVVDFSYDDLTLIDEFSCRHAIPPMEIVLEYWHSLYVSGSPKCLKSASKETVIDILRELRREQFLHQMGWD